jgi:hypothetical protein
MQNDSHEKRAIQTLGRFIARRCGRPRPNNMLQRDVASLALADLFTRRGVLDRCLGGAASVSIRRRDLEREQYNHWFPSRASDCGGRPPLVAHPELLLPRRPYRVEWEQQMFDVQRVYDYLATIELERKVSQVGQIQVGGRSLGVGRAWVGQTVSIRCDPVAREWVVEDREGKVVSHLPVRGVDSTSLTGLPDEPVVAEQPIQLTLPCFVA